MSKNILFIIILIIVLGAGAGTSYYFYHKYEQVKSNPQAEVQRQTADLIKKISKIIELPNETPTLAVVQDKNKLLGQTFFQNAEDGDIVLAFSNAMKVILYRPSTDKIIEVAPYNTTTASNNITVNQATTTTASATTSTTTI